MRNTVSLVVRTSVPVTSDGSPYALFRRALDRRYCAERPRITLELVDAVVAAFLEPQREPETGRERLHMLTRN